jgi:SAM-dependent methyltransferase
MSFSAEWDQAYREARQISVWPWSDLVSYVYRYARSEDGFRRVLELGCGAGANIPFFRQLGVHYWAIEGSDYAVKALREKFPELDEKIVVGDFTRSIPFEGPFDLVVDRASLTHNTTATIRQALALISLKMPAGSKLIGIDWFSAAHADAGKGKALDSHTRTEIASGQFQGVGAVHFADQDHLVGLLVAAGLVVERLEHKQIERLVPAEDDRLASWNFVAVKS